MTIKQFFIEAVKDAPVAGVAGASFFGLTLNDWVWVLGGLYALGRLVWFGVECYWKWKDRHGPRK